MVPRMDLRQLRYFSVLAETLNFHRAAERLHISQPPLTVAIRKLEDDLGAALFVREPRGVRLTPAGEAALPFARAALVAADDVRDAVRQGVAGVRGRLSIGFIGSAIAELLPQLISPFRVAYPLVELVLQETSSVEIVAAIASRQLDLGLVRLPLTGSHPVDVTVIERDELAVALPAHDTLAVRSSLSLGDLTNRDFILFSPISVLNPIIRMACQNAGFSPRVAQEAVQVQTILSLVEAGLGVALIPARSTRFATSRVRIVPLQDRVPLEMGLVHAIDAPPLVRNFVAAALATTPAEPK